MNKSYISLIMKLIVLYLLGGFLSLSAATYSQTITLKGKNLSLLEVLESVKRQSGYEFIVNSAILKNTKPIDVQVENMPLEIFMQKVFKGQPLQYTIEDETIVLFHKGAPRAEVTNAGRPSTSNIITVVQDYLVKGKVIDAKGKPIPNVTVGMIGTSVGNRKTDVEGGFVVKDAPKQFSMLFTAIGYQPVMVKVDDRKIHIQSTHAGEDASLNDVDITTSPQVFGVATNFTLRMVEVIQKLDDVVVTGIFKRSQESFTGSSTTISGDELKKISSGNIFTGVAAIDPAFRLVANNVMGGNINQMPEIQMRGQNSFPNLSGELSNNPNAPLFILDGFEVALQRIVDLDMNLINSITLLKDASATAIYGSRGANGVMVITTNTPKVGKMQVTVNNDFRLTTPDLSVYSLLNAYEKLDFERRAGLYTSESNSQQYRMDVLYNERLKAAVNGSNTDWKEIPVQYGYSNRTSLYLQGGDESVRYGVQVAADLQKGVMKGQDRNNYSGQFDLTYMVRNLRFNNSLRVFQNKSNESPYGDFSEYLTMNPYWVPYDGQGNAKKLLENLSIGPYLYTQTNPLYDATLHSVNANEYLGISNNFQIRYEPTSYLFLESSVNISKQNGSGDQFYSADDSRFNEVTDIKRKGSYTAKSESSFSYESITTANFNMTRGKHQMFSTAGFNFASAVNDYYTIIAEGFTFDRLDNLLFATQYQQNGKPAGDESTVRRVGFILNGNYSYDNRFLVDISYRRDGSSQYGTNKRFGDFWSTGFGWNIHHEKFLQQSDFINRLRLRTTYGSTGSLNIPAYASQTRYSFDVSSNYYDELGAIVTNLANPNLSWQNVYKFNLGIDATLLREKLEVRAEIYQEDTKNSLTSITLAPSTGFSSYSENLGAIRNRGLEFSARYKVLEDKEKGLLWSVNVNGFTNENILKKLSNKLKASNEDLNETNEEATGQSVPNVLFEEGQSMNAIYVVRSLGVDPTTGAEVYLTKSGVPTFEWNAADKVAYGVSIPKWNGNFGSSFMYKGFEVSLLFNYQFGGQLYNQTLVDKVESVDPAFNVDRRAYDLGWSGPGDISQYTRITTSKEATRATSRFVQDDDNLTLTSASLGYNFYRSPFLKKWKVRSLQVRAITNDIARFSSIEMERGTTNPFARTYSLSIRAGF